MKGAWTQQEDKRCRQGVKKELQTLYVEDNYNKTFIIPYGFSWQRVAFLVKTRDAKQCRERFTSFLAPNLIHSEWTIDEEERLKRLYKDQPGKWKLISEHIQGRSAQSCRMRWRKMQRNLKRELASVVEPHYSSNSVNGLEERQTDPRVDSFGFHREVVDTALFEFEMGSERKRQKRECYANVYIDMSNLPALSIGQKDTDPLSLSKFFDEEIESFLSLEVVSDLGIYKLN